MYNKFLKQSSGPFLASLFVFPKIEDIAVLPQPAKLLHQFRSYIGLINPVVEVSFHKKTITAVKRETDGYKTLPDSKSSGVGWSVPASIIAYLKKESAGFQLLHKGIICAVSKGNICNTCLVALIHSCCY